MPRYSATDALEQTSYFKALVEKVSHPQHSALAAPAYSASQTTYESTSESRPALTFEPSEWSQYDHLLRKAWPAIYPGR